MVNLAPPLGIKPVRQIRSHRQCAVLENRTVSQAIPSIATSGNELAFTSMVFQAVFLSRILFYHVDTNTRSLAMECTLPPVGVDVSKATLDLQFSTQSQRRFRRRIANTIAGFEEAEAFFVQQGASRVHLCMEATSTYADAAAAFFARRGHVVSIIKPNLLVAFRKTEAVRSKTDALDAMLLARFCEQKRPRAWIEPSLAMRTLQTLLARYDDLEQMIQQERNRLENGRLDEVIREGIMAHMEWMRQQQRAIKERAIAHVKEQQELTEPFWWICSITGIGELSAMRALGLVETLHRFKSARQLAAFVGVTPRERQSGTSVNGKPVMSREGVPAARKWLYMCALVAKRHDPDMRQWAQELEARGKTAKQILVAVMRKLLHIIYGVLTSKQPYDRTKAFPSHGSAVVQLVLPEEAMTTHAA